MLKTPNANRYILPDRTDSEILAQRAEERGEVRAGQGVDRKLSKYLKLQTRQIGRNLDGLDMPQPGELLFFLSQKDINTFTLLLWIIDKVGPLDELFVTTFNVNQDIIYGFAKLLDDGRVHSLSIVLSQSITSRMPERIEELRRVWETRREKMRVSLCWNHSKIALARAGEEKFILTGSGNYSFNAEIEQYEMLRDDALYDWVRIVLERRCFEEERMNKRHQVWGVDE